MSEPFDYDLSTGDVARQLHVHLDTVVKWADKGLLSCAKTPGGYRRFRQADIDTFAASMAKDAS